MTRMFCRRRAHRVPRHIGLLVLCAVCASAATLHAQGEHVQQPSGPGGVPRIKTHDDLQPAQLPPLPPGMSIQTIVEGDSIFHGKGACFACHGTEAQGLPAAGDALTVSLNWAQYQWSSIDSLIDAGIPQTLTRSPIPMPPRGGRSDLTPAEVHRVAAYVWAISQTRGEPWPGGHTAHGKMVPEGASQGTATRALTRPALPTTHRSPQ